MATLYRVGRAAEYPDGPGLSRYPSLFRQAVDRTDFRSERTGIAVASRRGPHRPAESTVRTLGYAGSCEIRHRAAAGAVRGTARDPILFAHTGNCGIASRLWRDGYSHSIVAGGFDEMS
jgi:hypothetical protein